MAGSAAHNRAARWAAVFIITTAIGFVAVWTLPRVSAAAATWAAVPAIRETTVRLEAGLAVAPATKAASGANSAVAPDDPPAAPAPETVAPGFRFDMVGVLCDQPPAGRARLVVALRTSEDGRTWGPWVEVDLELAGGPATGDGPDAGDGPAAFTEPVWVGSARRVQVRAIATGGAPAPSSLRGVRLMFLNTAGDGTATDRLVSTLRRTVAAIAGLGATPAAGAMTVTPDIVTREQWGADESWRGHAPEYAGVKMAFVHHTVNGNGYTRAQAPALVRGIYYYDTKGLKWSDLGYNFLIDRYGTIYEGRYGGITRGVIGAQVLGFNTDSTGIAMIGTFTSATPPTAMMGALRKLLAWKLDVHHVDPQGSATMVCRWTQKYREGQTVVFPVISGHRQANYTACPGTVLYGLLPGVRRAVAGMGLPKIYEYRVGTLDLSPNGDGVRESTRVRFRNSEIADWVVEVTDRAGDMVRRLEGRGAEVDVRWDGRDEAGAAVPDGVYRVTARCQVSGRDARPAVATVRVDTVAPATTAAAVTPAVFSPNGDGYGDRCSLRFVPTEDCSARVAVVDADGGVLRTVTGWRYGPAEQRSVAWDGRILSQDKLVAAPEGKALLRLDLRDPAGNEARTVVTARLDRTLGFLSATPATLSPNGDGTKDATALGFTLTRRAAVGIEIVRDGAVVRRLDAGTRDAGAHAVAWDGLLGDGSQATSGRYRYRARATSTLGDVVAARWVTVDRYRPRLTAPVRVSVALGRRARVAYVVRDPYSARVRVTATVRDRAGRTVATIDCGWVATGTKTAVTWKPPARRVYALTLTAVDRGGNRQYAPVSCQIVVR